MNKKLLLNLTVLLLLLIGCSTTQDEPQAPPIDNATETPVKMGETTTEDAE
ncbi:MAG: hypothetical protein KAG66_09735 [Methylococcales bacterium]|nr:hypothetical protein [Methylococcales bacterium]